jgi:hypothetical protein
LKDNPKDRCQKMKEDIWKKVKSAMKIQKLKPSRIRNRINVVFDDGSLFADIYR